MQTRFGQFLSSAAIIAAGIIWPSLAHGEALTATSRAKIVTQTNLQSVLDMNFGTIVTNGAGGDVVLDQPTGNRTCDPTLICQGNYDLATLLLTGSTATVRVNFQENVTLVGPGQDMDVLVTFPGGQGATLTVSNGSVNVVFGARLTVNPNQADGDYSGQFSVDVDYQ